LSSTLAGAFRKTRFDEVRKDGWFAIIVNVDRKRNFALE
jgi:hypothetical protein